MKTIKIGIIGAGRIGKIHADHLLHMPGAEIVAVSDLYAGDELRAWAAERGIPLVTNNSTEIMEHPDLDAVFICSSTDTHVPLIKQAAANGKHIFARSRSA